MKKYFSVFVLSILTCSHLLFAEDKNEDTFLENTAVPNPLELDKGWWEYFEVSADELQYRIKSFLEKIKDLEKSLNTENHKDILDLTSQITFNLEMLKTKKTEITLEDPKQLKYLQEYSFSDLFEVQENLIETISEIGVLKDKINSQKIPQNLTRSRLDKHILQYQSLSHSSYERLLSGLNIIETRIISAIHNSTIQILEESIENLSKQKKILEDELANAEKSLSFQNTTISTLTQEWKEAQKQADKAESKLYHLEIKSLHQRTDKLQSELYCCLWENEIFFQRIKVETFKLAALSNQIKLMIYQIITNKSQDSTETFQEDLITWKKEITHSKESQKLWQKQLEDSHSEVNNLTADLIKEEGENFSEKKVVSELHLELTKVFSQLGELSNNIVKSELLFDIVESRFVEHKSISEAWTLTLKHQLNEFFSGIQNIADIVIFRINEEPVTVGILFRSLFSILFAIAFSKYLRKFLVAKKIVVRSFSRSTEYIVLKFIHYIIMIIGVLMALGLLGFDFTKITIIAGALGVGIGFGLQSMVSNVISGFTLLLNKYLKVGDIVKLENEILGRVKSIYLQNTQIETFDGSNIIIPNSQLTSQQLINWTMYNNYHRFRIPFGVAYGSDKNQIRELVIDVVKKLPYVVTSEHNRPNPEVWFKEFGDSSLNFELVAWVDLSIQTPHGTASSSLLWEVDTVLKENNIEIPFPQRDLRVKEFPKGFSLREG